MEIDLGAILVWLKNRRAKKKLQTIQTAMLQLNALTVTIHGRQLLSTVCKDEGNGLPNEIRRMYWVLLKEAPIKEWSQWN